MKILIVNFDKLGDVVFSSYIAHFLSQRMPEAQIDVLSSTYGHQVAKYYPGVRRVFHFLLPWRLTIGGRRGSYISFFKFIFRLRRIRYDIMFCASPSWKDVLAARMVRADKYVGFVKRPFIERLLTHPCPFPGKEEPIVLAMQRLVLTIFPDAMQKSPRYRLDYSIVRSNPHPPESFILFHPFAGDQSKHWTMENWLQLAKRLRSYHLIYWIGSPAEIKKLHEENHIPLHEIPFLNQQFSITDTIELIKQAKMFVGHDSGPTHLTGSLGQAGVALYPLHTSKKYLPQGIGRFEMLVGDPITEITIEEVFDAVLRGLADGKKSEQNYFSTDLG